MQWLLKRFLFELFQIFFIEYPFRGINFSVIRVTQFVPGGFLPVYRIGQYMDMLGRHITLCQQEYFLFCLWVNGHIDDNNGMPRVTALDKYVTYLHLLVIDRSQFFRQGGCSCIGKYHIQIGTECFIGIILSCL